jgi:ElaB/YqjD/DUF883 family membrane-anchored ribosome-binding protein
MCHRGGTRNLRGKANPLSHAGLAECMTRITASSELQGVFRRCTRGSLVRGGRPLPARRLQEEITMANEITNAFPETRNDVKNLKQTATDAAKDLASTATTHLNKARGQAQDFAAHAQSEARDQLGEVQGQVGDLLGAARDYVLARPLTCVGVALGIGFLFGLRRGSRG